MYRGWKDRPRTCNLSIWNRLLCQLSYLPSPNDNYSFLLPDFHASARLGPFQDSAFAEASPGRGSEPH